MARIFRKLRKPSLRFLLGALLIPSNRFGFVQEPPRIGPVPAAANLLTRIDPVYPALARAARVQGAVTIDVMIDKEGRVNNPKVVTGHVLLNDSALEAVRQWRYTPHLLNGQPTEIVTEVQMRFSLSESTPVSDVGEIRGRIRHVDGSPAPLMPVAAILSSDTGSASPAFVARTLTDDSGTYRLSSIPAGRYHIEAGMNGPTYYPGTTNLSESVPVIMAMDRANVVGVDLTMSPPVSVRGRIAGSVSAAALGAIRVQLIATHQISNFGSRARVYVTPVTANGSFELTGVLPGTYSLFLQTQTPLMPSMDSGQTIEVGGVDVKDKVLRNPGAFVVRVQEGSKLAAPLAGRVVLNTAGQTSGIGEFLFAAIRLSSTPVSNQHLFVSTSRDGSFVLPITEGSWLVYRSGMQPTGYLVQSISYGATDLLKESLDLSATAAGEIRVTLQAPVGSN
ncbi:MAG TPA: TonB family protein [Terriglobia bacterium]|nr:TonB family protein [Terriglobia bacterium]